MPAQATEFTPRAADITDVRRARRYLPHTSTGHSVATTAGLWLLLSLAVAAAEPAFRTHEAIVSIGFSLSTLGILAAGMAVVTVSGGLVDLSVPTSTGLAALLCTSVLAHHSSWLAVIAALGAGIGYGLVNAFVIVVLKINPIVATLGTNFAGMGLVNLVFKQEFVRLTSGLRHLAIKQTLGMPATFWLMLVFVCLTAAVIRNTRYGRHVVAVGGNAVAAERQGINLATIRVATFVFMGLCAGIVGALYAGSAQVVVQGDTDGLLFPTVTAVILSGVSLAGGEGSLLGVLVGAGFLATVPTSLVTLGASPDLELVVQGVMLALAVSIDGYRRRRRLA